MTVANLRSALSAIPPALLGPLIEQFEAALAEYRAGDWEKVGMKAGKFCELAYCICEGHATRSYANAPSKPRNIFDACRALEKHNGTRGRSVCIQIPRVLMSLYELRNNRAIGHVSSEIDPNHMDAEFFLRGMKWVMAEFIRFFSSLAVDDSRDLVEAVTARSLPVVWRSGNTRRVLDPAKSADEKMLILAYTESSAVAVVDLLKWSEYANGSRLRREVLKKLHMKAWIHFDPKADTVQILPPGQRYVESNSLLEIS
ncbi:MAG: hypothetical protein NXH97_15040 [Rhodobacteraceae bacterium]|nr:hypothetical protein [Paracoccaceae bacterium]